MRLPLILLAILTLAGALALGASEAEALTLRGKVVSVADGDTITVRTGRPASSMQIDTCGLRTRFG